MDGRPKRRNKAAFSISSGELWALPKVQYVIQEELSIEFLRVEYHSY